MTHDPREALETIPTVVEQLERVLPRLKDDIVTSFAIGCAIDTLEALSASALKGEPDAWRHVHPSGHDHLTRTRLTDADKKDGWSESPLYTSPPPAAGWDEAINWLEGIANNDGNAYQHVARRAVELLKDGTALRCKAPAPSGVADTSQLLTITYTNYKGETSVRRIAPKSIRFGSTERHPEPQWLLLAWDIDKQADREFALKDFWHRTNHLLKLANENVERLADKVALLESRPDAGGGVRVPQGYALVPAKPTPAMIEAGCEQNPTQWNEGTDLGFAADVANDVYVAMVRAATLSTPSDAVNESAEAPQWPANLHPLTLDLVKRFAVALAEKLCLAEEKYGYSDNWQRDDWKDDCQHKLIKHITKGDPRDVAAYCAFMWHHGWPTVILDSDELAGCREVLREATVKNAKQAAMIADLNDMVLRYAHRAETNASAEALELAYGLLWIVGCDRQTTSGNALYLARNSLYERIDKDGQARGITSARKALADNPFYNLPDPVDTGVFPRTDGRPGHTSTGDGASGDVAVIRNDGNPERAARSDGLSAEARLREALLFARTRIEYLGRCAGETENNEIAVFPLIDKALSPSGDEAKKSEGGEPDVERTQRRLAVSDDGLGPMQVIPRETPSVPSDPPDPGRSALAQSEEK